ncbi:MAG: 50S ribosomal protein L28 [Planctomycetes bacterium]|nr:50S ribosomal protein L28 [Planctomycetota bacterium]
MGRTCQVTGKKTRFGNQIARRGMAKKKGGVGIKITGISRRKFKPNLQRVRVLLPDGTVQRMTIAASVIRSGQIRIKVDGRLRWMPLIKAARGRNRAYRESQKKEEAVAVPATPPQAAAETPVSETAAVAAPAAPAPPTESPAAQSPAPPTESPAAQPQAPPESGAEGSKAAPPSES